MAKTKTWTPRRVRSEEERSTGSAGYIQLDEGEKFLGNALFEGNPAEDEPGYYEYLEHWNQASRRSIPCAGDDCPFCEDGDKPKTRAKSLWFVIKDNKGTEVNELRTFNLNFNLIKQFTEMRGEDDKIKGRLFRVSRLDDRGNYSLMPKTEILKAKEVKEHLKDKNAPDFDQAVTSQLRKAMEGVAIARAMDEDDDEEEDEKPKGKSGKGKAAKKKSGDEWPEEGDEEEVTVDEADDDNFLLVSSDEYEGAAKMWGTSDLDVTDIEDGATVTISWFTDDEDDFVLTAVEEGEADEEEADKDEDNNLPDTIEDETFEVEGVDESESTIDVKSDDLAFTLYFLDTMEVDFADYEPGIKIKVSAEKDTAGDMVATEVPEIQKKKPKQTAKKTGGKKTTKKTGKGGKKK